MPACELICVWCKDAAKLEELRGMQNVAQRLRGIHGIIKRKEALMSRSNAMAKRAKSASVAASNKGADDSTTLASMEKLVKLIDSKSH